MVKCFKALHIPAIANFIESFFEGVNRAHITIRESFFLKKQFHKKLRFAKANITVEVFKKKQ